MIHEKTALVHECLEDLQTVRHAFAAEFYRRLFAALPRVRALFMNDMKHQEMMLFAIMSMLFKRMESGQKITQELIEFGQMHYRVGVREEMLPFFGSVFLDTMKDFLPARDHPQLAVAWWAVFTDISVGIIEGMRWAEAEERSAHRVFGRGVRRAG